MIRINYLGVFQDLIPNFKNLSKGSKGKRVKQLQENLNILGYTDNNNMSLVVDGYFDKSTKEALIKFQKANNITADGVYGEKSNASLVIMVKKAQKKIR